MWDGKSWKTDDTGEALRRGSATVRTMYAEASQLEAKASQLGDDATEERRVKLAGVAEALSKWARKSESRSRIEAMVKLAESRIGIPILPHQLDKDLWVLNCENGTLDLRTGQLRSHRREDLITKLAPVEYHPDAPCPLWDAFLDRVMDRDLSKKDYLQRNVGMSLTGDVAEHKIVVAYGTGRNGKSTFLETILAVMGDYGRKAPTDFLMTKKGEVHPTEKTLLFGVRFVPVVETSEGRRLDETQLKELTGGDTVTARRMREDFWQFTPTHHLWLATNHKPIIRGTDEGIWSRVSLVQFTVTIPEGERDRRLKQKLRAEWPGILSWAVRGCLAWQRDGLQEPSVVGAATAGYRRSMDILSNFLEERCVQFPEAQCEAGELYQSYCGWCDRSGERLMSKVEFGQRLQERGFEPARGPKGVRRWKGVGLLGDHDE